MKCVNFYISLQRIYIKYKNGSFYDIFSRKLLQFSQEDMFGARSVVITVSNSKTEIKLIHIHEKLFIFNVQAQMLLTGSRIILTLRYKKDCEHFVWMRVCFKLLFYKPIGNI
jgi:hypothetical protein